MTRQNSAGLCEPPSGESPALDVTLGQITSPGCHPRANHRPGMPPSGESPAPDATLWQITGPGCHSQVNSRPLTTAPWNSAGESYETSPRGRS